MTIHVHVSGTLAADPVQRTGQSGKSFTTASIRSGSGDEAVFINIVGFAEAAERLAELHKGDGVSVAGRGELKTWTGKDGTERTGLSVVASEIAAGRPRPKAQERGNGNPRPPAARRPYARQQRAAEPAGDPRPFNDDLLDLYSRGEP